MLIKAPPFLSIAPHYDNFSGMKDKTGWNKYRHKRKPAEARDAELLIETLTNSGDGLGRLDERVVFVPYTLPGDKVRVKITQQKKTYALAEVVEILEPGAERVTPECHFFTQCGGCDWQHVPYFQQLEAKEQQLRDTLSRIGLLNDLPIEPIAHTDNPYHYRNRIQGEYRNGQFFFKRRRSDQRVAVSRCEIAEEPINEWLQQDHDDSATGKVEIAIVGDQVVALPMNEKNSTDLGFRQVNSAINTLLTQRLLGIIEASDSHGIVDLYCGRGTWTNLIAQHHPDKTVCGVDSSEENIQAARQESQAKGLKNTQFHLASVEKIIAKLSIENSLCIVDPPRAGLALAVTEQLIKHPSKTLIYISCHPATLARDLKLLTDAQYKVKSLLPLDMFPQTAHLECLVHMEVSTE